MKFSVIIPTYSRPELLEKALTSVSNQSYKHYEIIVVNDNPADKFKIDAIASKHIQTKVIHHSKPKGGNAARNSGIVQAEGELIAFLDDDDIWLPEKLFQHFTEHAKNSNAGLLYSDCLYVYDKPSVPDVVYAAELPADVIKAMGTGLFCPATSSIVTIKKECVTACGLFDETLPSFQDWDYWFRIAHKFDFVRIPEILVHFTQHLGERTSQNENKRRKGLQQITTKWAKEIDVTQFKKTSLTSIYYKNSRNALLAGRKFAAFTKGFKLLNYNVISIKSVIGFIRLCFSIIKT